MIILGFVYSPNGRNLSFLLPIAVPPHLIEFVDSSALLGDWNVEPPFKLQVYQVQD